MPWAGPHNEEDKRMVKIFTTMIGNFIRSGNPSLERKLWLPYFPGQGRVMHFNSPIDVEMSRCLPFPFSRLNLWRHILNISTFVQGDYLTCALADHETTDVDVNEEDANYGYEINMIRL